MTDNKRIADALNSLASANIHGNVDDSDLRLLINDYFGGVGDVV